MKAEGFLEKTIHNVTGGLERALVAEDLACRPGLLQGLDPRAKVVTFLLLMISVALVRSLPLLAGFAILPLVLSWLSRVSPAYFLKRVGLFIPLFTGIVALPALFTTPGTPLLNLWDGVAITAQGLRAAITLVMRSWDTLSLAVLLVLTTRWSHLLRALRVLLVPRAFVQVLQMTHRYIYLFLRNINSMFLARRSRTLGPQPSGQSRRFLASSMATLLARSHSMSEEIYLAMLSRGFRGDVMAMEDFSLKRRDALWAVLAALLAAAALSADRCLS
jgi:cobalt/nickel transport system permease protein